MANSQDPYEPEAPGLPESVRLLLASAAGYLHARFQLLGLEFKDAGINYVKIVILLVMSVLFLIFGYIFLVVAAACLVSWAVNGNWGWVTLGFGLGHIVLAGGCLWVAKSRFGVDNFASTIAEFKKDKEWLSQTKTTAPRSANLSVARTS
jgi:uncharacterized membrane protein YqjE